jgi:hypothetical protein
LVSLFMMRNGSPGKGFLPSGHIGDAISIMARSMRIAHITLYIESYV